MNPGKNTVEVYARSTDGTDGRREVTVSFLPGASTQELSPRQVAQRNRLLENRLLDLQRRNVEIRPRPRKTCGATRRSRSRRSAGGRTPRPVRKDIQISAEKAKAQPEPKPDPEPESGSGN
jgi:hypothetical protein